MAFDIILFANDTSTACDPCAAKGLVCCQFTHLTYISVLFMLICFRPIFTNSIAFKATHRSQMRTLAAINLIFEGLFYFLKRADSKRKIFNVAATIERTAPCMR
jgi:hypothetical protein